MEGPSKAERIAARAVKRAARIAARAKSRGELAAPIGAPSSETPFTDVSGRPVYLDGMGRGGACFIVLSGPSIGELDLSLLSRRGIYTLGVNNSPAIFRPNLWTCVDPPEKFHEGIWLDPGVIKSVPATMAARKVRTRDPNGVIVPMTRKTAEGKTEIVTAAHMPGVILHKRAANFNPETWLSEPVINWGHSKKSARRNKRNKRAKGLCVMLAVLKHAYVLGFRAVFLLGCDWSMTSDKPYAFNEKKCSAGAVGGTNNLFAVVADWLEELRPHFDTAGFRVFNCYEKSQLTVFPYLPYSEAIDVATGHVPQDPLECNGWYTK